LDAIRDFDADAVRFLVTTILDAAFPPDGNSTTSPSSLPPDPVRRVEFTPDAIHGSNTGWFFLSLAAHMASLRVASAAQATRVRDAVTSLHSGAFVTDPSSAILATLEDWFLRRLSSGPMFLHALSYVMACATVGAASVLKVLEHFVYPLLNAFDSLDAVAKQSARHVINYHYASSPAPSGVAKLLWDRVNSAHHHHL
jgi:hypothetical protein